ncbi:MAG: DUF721 domain-containing protein [Candidatus Omnitrophica bacterium]|jgi:hypothetical protein|nr:DUF721 domain-containing protein [Candidatus Omnitrophota bacterium]
MEPIKNTIQQVFEGWQGKNKPVSSDEPGAWLKKTLAKKALSHVKLYNFRKGILSIKVDSSTWLYYLSVQKQDLLKKMQRESEAIKDIRFSLGD